MIYQLANKYQKRAAAFFFVLFYGQLVTPLVAKAFGPADFYNPYYHAPKIRSTDLFFGAKNIPAIEKTGKKPLAVTKKKFSPSITNKGTIGGPGQPEMSSFKSVNANDMVDLFTGDFSYNIPLMDVGGYPVNIHYGSGISMDQEASWVGLGWNINPGTISRSVRGLPDDFNGNDTISKTQSIKVNKTVGVSVGSEIELAGFPISSLNGSLGIFHNTYNGWGTEIGLHASINAGSKSYGPLSGGLGLNSNSQSGVNVSPSIGFKLPGLDHSDKISASLGLSTNYNSRVGISSLQLSATASWPNSWGRNVSTRNSDQFNFPGASISFATPTYTPSISMPYTSTNYAFHAKIGGLKWVLHGTPITLEGYVSKQEIKAEDKFQKKPAVGYLYYSKSNDNINTLMDFNREKEVAFNAKATPVIAIPQYTYDIYSISGEGTGGMFRPYRGDVGFTRDNYMRSKSKSDRLSVDLGFGNVFHLGVDFTFTNSYSENNLWASENSLNKFLKFRENDTTYEAVYFRNPGEKTTNAQAYYAAIGGDTLLRTKLVGEKDHVSAANAFSLFVNDRKTRDLPVNAAIVKQQRDKRSQVISYMTAADASVAGLDKQIFSYKENSIPGVSCTDSSFIKAISRVDGTVRKKHHLSQVTVLNGDGRRYIYGIPAYNLEQQDVTFSVNKETNSDNLSKGLVQYSAGTDNSVNNDKGKENIFTREVTPAYAHSFLLSGILSPDYVDIKNDGITDDDMGDAVKFNYTRIYSGDTPFAWRTPFQQNLANYNEGLKTYNRDDRGTYLYGKKEVWYLNSIESKTMVAVFKLDSNRTDIYSVSGENGGLNTSKKLRKLKQIDLYVKADLVKKGANARPVKTVHFVYSYKLCKGVSGDPDLGKLTLDSIWFSYNGNTKGKLNPYVFRYHASDTTYNPRYNVKSYDRWGNYKKPENPGGLSNMDYPYVVQDSAKANKNAAAWTLDEIQLPSGGKIKASYEADDYAYVQNKRASQLFQMLGFGSTKTSTPVNKLYETPGMPDNDFVFIHSDATLANKQDVFQKYLQGNEYIYFKLSVKVPSDKWGSGDEYVPVYAQVADYDTIGNHTFWLRLKHVDSESPLTRSALQFLRLNLPSKAYSNSEPGDDIDVWSAVKMLATSLWDIKNAFSKYETQARTSGFCKVVTLDKSFVRLSNPDYKKLGGGLRVKRIEIYDNWHNMTGQKESVYGQEYNYSKTEMINGTEKTISSGVASYEPMIGAEENPFHIPVNYVESSAPMAPVNDMFIERPLGESYFPSASVGYTKVRVRTINAKAKSVNGWQETEFFTTRDFPTIVENTIIDPDSKKKYNPKLSGLLRLKAKNFITLSQGFKIELNDMNGKVKSQLNFAETDSLHPISSVRNFYKVDNDSSYQKHLNNKVWIIDSLNGHISKDGIIGNDIEVMQDIREQESKTLSINVSPNIDLFFIGPFLIPFPSAIPLPQQEEVRFRSAATVKIVQRYGILDSVSAVDKGSRVSTKNLVYDGETGEVVLSRTNNEFNDPIFNFSYPAHWAYSGMGMAYKNIDAVFKNLKLVKGVLFYGGASVTPYPVERFFESGDEVQLSGFFKNTQSGDGNCLQFVADTIGQPVIKKPFPMRAWAIDGVKGNAAIKGIYFIDGDGNPITMQVESMRILRSGKRNMLDASVGSIVSMINPIKEITTGNYKLVFDSTSRVINTSAVTYKDKWKGENFSYPKDTVIKVYRYHTVHLSPQITHKKIDIISKTAEESSTVEDAKFVGTIYEHVQSHDDIACHVSGRNIQVRSILNFNFDDIPADAVVQSASMSFTPVAARELTNRATANTCNGAMNGNNWATETRDSAGTPRTYLKRLVSPWNNETNFRNLSSTDVHRVLVNFNGYTNLNCTNLVTDMLSHPNYGISFEIDKVVANSNTTSEVNFLNFCGETNPTTGCTAPDLKITYQTLEDSLAPRCKTLADDPIVNPYKLGLLGNWRVDRAYTFYHDRKESDATFNKTNIRKEGELKSFSPFWKLTDTLLTPLPDTDKWVWNSASSLYSKKGFEIENYDPLGRYNAGLYGYNGTLPIAVAQNSRYREIFYDGFEDYNYKSRECTNCPTTRELDFLKASPGAWLTDTISHTGLYSLKVKAGSIANYITSVSAAENDTTGVTAGVHQAPSAQISYHGIGSGAELSIEGYRSLYACPDSPVDSPRVSGSLTSNNLSADWGSGKPLSTICSKWFEVTGGELKILAPTTDNYHFYGISDQALEVYVNDVKVVEAAQPNVENSFSSIHLTGDSLYTITFKYVHTTSNHAYMRVRWSRDGNGGIITSIPLSFLYNHTDIKIESGGVRDSTPIACVNADTVKMQNFIRPSFSLLLQSKYAISGWIKMDGNDCNTAPVLDTVLKVKVRNVWNDLIGTVWLKKTGVRIEGWQRYEGVINLGNYSYPGKIELSAVAPSDRNIFLDDFRVQPYNSSMKSYAYNQINLRLMGELDENNYATFYEYDDDGTLIRVKKETERGVMTIKESRSALLKNQ